MGQSVLSPRDSGAHSVLVFVRPGRTMYIMSTTSTSTSKYTSTMQAKSPRPWAGGEELPPRSFEFRVPRKIPFIFPPIHPTPRSPAQYLQTTAQVHGGQCFVRTTVQRFLASPYMAGEPSPLPCQSEQLSRASTYCCLLTWGLSPFIPRCSQDVELNMFSGVVG